MIAVAVKDFKNHLSKYLNEVVNGKPVLITKHGRVVAKVMPYDPEVERQAIEDRLAGSVKFYHKPTEPAGQDDWEALDESTD
jgi:prevent-host-death family protein